MEEDIEKIENLIEGFRKAESVDLEDKKEIYEKLRYFHYKAIENILNRLEQLEKENKKLTEARNWYFEHTVNKAVTPEMLHKILRQDYIPKSVIRDKITERQFELQQEYEDFETDIRLNTLIEILGEE